MQIYFAPFWSKTEPFYLSEEESRHCVSVMRNQVGNFVYIMDGKGCLIEGEIIQAHPKKTQILFRKISQETQNRHPLEIAISPTKSNDRFEWFLEKACELGVGKITPLLFHRTERTKINRERWEKIIVASCKQSRLLCFPEISEPIKFEKWISTVDKENTYIASIESKMKFSFDSNSSTTIVIGPEGDFSEEEFKMIREQGLKEFSLSKNILRVETAGLAACCLVNSVLI